MINVRVFRKQIEAEGIFSYELVREDGLPLPPVEAGAHIDVHLPGGLTRQYSLCNAPGETHRYQIAVLREAQSRGGSIALHDVIHEGDVFTISEPRNHFPLEKRAGRSLLLAGGIGITPLLSMAMQLSAENADFALHYCGRTEKRMAFLSTIGASVFSENVHYHIDDGPQDQQLHLQNLLSEPWALSHLYVCGPAGFVDAILNTAAACGWNEEQLHREYFTCGQGSDLDDEGFSVRIASTGETFNIPAGQSIVSVLIEAGIDIPVSCEEGMCGSCVTDLLEVQGQLEHRDIFLSRKQKEEGKIFTPCCSRAKGGGLLVLDI